MLDSDQRIGFVSIPHGYGMQYLDPETEEMIQFGPWLNLLTSSRHSYPIAKTPYHKYVPVHILPLT